MLGVTLAQPASSVSMAWRIDAEGAVRYPRSWLNNAKRLFEEVLDGEAEDVMGQPLSVC